MSEEAANYRAIKAVLEQAKPDDVIRLEFDNATFVLRLEEVAVKGGDLSVHVGEVVQAEDWIGGKPQDQDPR